MNRTKYRLRLLALGLLLPVLLCSCRGETPPAGRPPVPVSVASAVKTSVPRYVEAIGNTSSSQSVDIVPQVSGKILEVHFMQGSDVKAGDLLFTIDPRPYQAALHDAEAAVAKAEAELVLSQETLKRWLGLQTSNYVSPQDIDALKSKVRSNEAELASKRASLETAKINLDYCTIHSPLDGVAGTYQVYAGNVVTAGSGTPLVNIQAINLLYVDFTLPESDLLEVKRALAEGKSLGVDVASLTDSRVTGQADLKVLDNQVKSQSGTVMLRALLHNQNRLFWPGQSVQVKVILQNLPDAIVIPIQALQYGQQGPFVFIITPEQKAAIRAVRPGQRQTGENIAILSGLSEHDQVVVAGHLMLAPDSPVMIIPAQGSAVAPHQAQGAEGGPGH